MIYFIRQDDKVKIGYTEDINNRLSQLKTGSPYELTVALLIEGDYDKKKELHDTFSDFRIRGEWYEFCEDIQEYITSMNEKDLRYEEGLLDKEGLDPNVQTTFIRVLNSLKLREVGEKLNITPQSVREIETRELHGTVSLNILRKYGRVLGYDLVYKFIRTLQ